jgi:hypothetical protein
MCEGPKLKAFDCTSRCQVNSYGHRMHVLGISRCKMMNRVPNFRQVPISERRSRDRDNTEGRLRMYACHKGVAMLMMCSIQLDRSEYYTMWHGEKLGHQRGTLIVEPVSPQDHLDLPTCALDHPDLHSVVFAVAACFAVASVASADVVVVAG